ncbi:MAG: hypothetical protein M1836_000818 [Candelina mexicana]|nr:MAG: hypothetical protein M1836_000818 [Candelina mexicana]
MSDCKALSPGDAALYKRALEVSATRPRVSELSGASHLIHIKVEALDARPSTNQEGTLKNKRNKRSTLRRRQSMAYMLASTKHLADESKCKVTTIGAPATEAGKQVLVANPSTCSIALCSFAISHAVTVSITYSTNTEMTMTTSAGASIPVKAGIDFISDAEVTGTLESLWAKAVSESTGTSITHGYTVTVTDTLGQQIGITACATFTPIYLCWATTVSCGGEGQAGMNYSQPQFGSDGKTLQGDYTVVYTG